MERSEKQGEIMGRLGFEVVRRKYAEIRSRNEPLIRAVAWALWVLLVLPSATPILAEEASDLPTDVDGTKAEEHKKREGEKSFPVLVVPVLITEPAIGSGLGLGIGYFHKREREAEDTASISPVITLSSPPGETSGDERKPPPVISGIAGGYTNEGTRGAGFGHMNNWKQDGIRYAGAVGYINVESTFYFSDRPFDFNLESWLTAQNVKFRIARSDFFVGFKWLYVDAEGRFRFREDLPIDFPGRSRVDSGLAVQASWDTLDNTMTPDRGQLFEIDTWRFDDAIGGDYHYWKVQLKAFCFHPFAERFVLGLRLEVDAIDGDPPLWGYPWITLRGVSALRYQNEKTVVLETELRWDILDRWAVLGFVGVGGTRGDIRIYEDESGVVAGGVGGRWLFRPQDRLWVGVDVARGPEDTYGYIQVGHAW